MPIICVERVLVAVADLDAACERWSRAGFAVASGRRAAGGVRFARLAAGAVEIDLCAIEKAGAEHAPDLLRAALARGGGAAGWTWGVTDRDASPQGEINALPLPVGPEGETLSAAFVNFLPGVWTGTIAAQPSAGARARDLLRACGINRNSTTYLEHIVVMTPSLEGAIAAHERLGLCCKRIREAGGGVRQAFFKLEQTVLEIAGPARGSPQVWGLAFMCDDIGGAVELARRKGLEATEPKTAIQGGRIARIVEPLDGVAVAFMEAAPPA